MPAYRHLLSVLFAVASVEASGCAVSHLLTFPFVTVAAPAPSAGANSADSPANDFASRREPRDDLARLPRVEAASFLGDDAFGPSPARAFDEDTRSMSTWLDQQIELGSIDDSITRLPSADDPNATFADVLNNQWAGICSDYAEFYSPRGLEWIAAGIGAGALMANSGFDAHTLRDSYSESIVFAPSDELYEKLHQPKFLGEGYFTIPAFAIAALAEPLIDDLPGGPAVAQWGQRSFRTVAVGAPPMLALQALTGGSRPGETLHRSHWEPFNDNNGVSGHSFMGAVPFMSAAKMTDRLWLKGGLYAASTLPALSRVNDDDHYFSQAFLGWWLAYLAANAVDRSHDPDASYRLFAFPTPSGAGVGVEFVR